MQSRDVCTEERCCPGCHDGLRLLSERLLGVQIDKSLQTSDWDDLTDEKINYAAIDAAVSLQLTEILEEMPNLSHRLTLDKFFQPKKWIWYRRMEV